MNTITWYYHYFPFLYEETEVQRGLGPVQGHKACGRPARTELKSSHGLGCSEELPARLSSSTHPGRLPASRNQRFHMMGPVSSLVCSRLLLNPQLSCWEKGKLGAAAESTRAVSPRGEECYRSEGKRGPTPPPGSLEQSLWALCHTRLQPVVGTGSLKTLVIWPRRWRLQNSENRKWASLLERSRH